MQTDQVIVDGRGPFTWAQFVQSSDFSPEQLADIRAALMDDGVYRAGGGPEPEYVIEVATAGLKKYWVSWFHRDELGAFELTTPWWESGSRISANRLAFDEPKVEPSICAAVMASSPEDAQNRVLLAYDIRPTDIEWRFVEERPADWSPFSGRFPKAAWMEWDKERT